MKRYWTQDELELTLKLVSQGFTLREISERTGRGVGSIKVFLCEYRKGKRQFYFEKAALRREKMIEEYVQGSRIVDIARALEVHPNTVHKIFTHCGFDAEVRQEARSEFI